MNLYCSVNSGALDPFIGALRRLYVFPSIALRSSRRLRRSFTLLLFRRVGSFLISLKGDLLKSLIALSSYSVVSRTTVAFDTTVAFPLSAGSIVISLFVLRDLSALCSAVDVFDFGIFATLSTLATVTLARSAPLASLHSHSAASYTSDDLVFG